MADGDYNFPVFGTQGGGLARRSGDTFVFVEVPDWGDFNVGDEVPRGWDVARANELARREDDAHDEGDTEELGLNDPEKVGQIWVNGVCKDLYVDRLSTAVYLLAAGLEIYTGIVLDRDEHYLAPSERPGFVVIDELVPDDIERIIGVHHAPELSAQAT